MQVMMVLAHTIQRHVIFDALELFSRGPLFFSGAFVSSHGNSRLSKGEKARTAYTDWLIGSGA